MTPNDHVDGGGAVEVNERGLTRRNLIRGAAAATAAGWVAPVLIDSIASPAAAGSPKCDPYFVKVSETGVCNPNCPGCGEGKVNSQAPQSSVTFPVNGVKWAGSCNKPGDCDPPPDQCSECCLATGSNKMPTVDFNYSSDYVKVTLATGCKFSLETDWQIGGRYGASDPGDRYVKNVDAPCPNNMPFSPTGDACWVSTGSSNTGYIKKFYNGDNTRPLNYIYLKFCC